MNGKKIALIAHNAKKDEICMFAQEHKEFLSQHLLIGTEGTARIISEKTGLNVIPLDHGPDGGDIRLANKVLDGEILVLFFFIDMETPFGHEVDISSLIRICVIKDVPIALNNQTAHLIVKSLKKS
ncbi:MAG: methylglyoxal synthase [Candidatus Lokiarchaeota archaeon]|nr:methylglyoxal synthase [Candidatus Lokiarchaeota archaeon]